MEEQACLVRTRSDSESSSKLGSFGSITRSMAYTEDRLTGTEGAGEPGNGGTLAAPEHAESTESGELLDYNDSSVLEQFHEDALRQAGCGLSQIRVVLAVGLALCGATLELAAIPFILPSAEIELCILPHEKNWLVMITVVGWSLGSVGWGALAERLGRRRTLVSCLAVNAVFATIAAFMPTYGTFMMARFCSAIGSGGIVPAGWSYAHECVVLWWSGWSRCVIAAASAGGLLLAAALAHAQLPATGPETLRENKEHFSAWHRYLLLCTLPILASLVSLIWTPESPRYLLDVGREVDAMMVYQNIHSSNQFRLCGKAAAPTADAEYRLGELSLPGKRRPPALHHVRHSVKMFWQAFFQLFSSTYRNTTLSLGGTLLFVMAIQFYLSSYIPATVLQMESAAFEAAKQTITDVTYDNVHYNDTLQNVRYANVTWRHCSFRDLLLSHVQFDNCTFSDVAFANIKTSHTAFTGSTFINTTMIDTDMEYGREISSECVLNGTTIRGMRGGCSRHADLRSRLSAPLARHAALGYAALAAAPLTLLPLRQRPRPQGSSGLALYLLIPSAACLILSPGIYVSGGETLLYALEALYRAACTLVFYCVSTGVLCYPAHLRCTAHGLLLSVCYMGATAALGAGPGGPPASALVAGLFALAAMAAAFNMR